MASKSFTIIMLKISFYCELGQLTAESGCVVLGNHKNRNEATKYLSSIAN
jgi:hypothetical protein